METQLHAGALRPRMEVATRTDPGRDPDKQVNEDAFAYRPTAFGHLLVVCDGMGGHLGGEDASNLALRTLLEVVESAPADAPPREVLAHAVRMANERVYGLAAPDMLGRPGSTIVLALVQAEGAVIAHVGDSRCYLVRQGQALALTKDHSVVQQMVDQGLISQEQAANHPDANRILRALGVAPTVDVEVRDRPVPFSAGDAFLLCSDGLTDLVSGPEIARVVHDAGTVERAVTWLVDLANERGGHDNITVIMGRVRDDSTAHATPTVVATQPETQSQSGGRGNTLRPGPGHPHALPSPQSGGPPLPLNTFGGMMPPTTPARGTAMPVPGAPISSSTIGGHPYAEPAPHSSPHYGDSARIPFSQPHGPPSVPPSRHARRRDRGVLLIALLLAGMAMVVLIGVGIVLWTSHHPHSRTPSFVDSGVPDNTASTGTPSAPATVDVAPGAEPSPLPSLLAAPSTTAPSDRPRFRPHAHPPSSQ